MILHWELDMHSQNRYSMKAFINALWITRYERWVIKAIIGSDNGLSPVRRQAIIWSNAGLLLIGLMRSTFIEIWIQIHFLWKKIDLEMSSVV